MKKEINKTMMKPTYLEEYFSNKGYECLNPFSVVNNGTDTIFTTAGIQPVLRNVMNGNLSPNNIYYVGQPVLRSQFIKSLGEGYSLAFNNCTTVAINNSSKGHDILVDDWLKCFYDLGLEKKYFSTRSEEYTDKWGEIELGGYKTFYIYKDTELGDATYFNYVSTNNRKVEVKTFSDVGFGLERIRWVCNPQKSYYDINGDTSMLEADKKAIISAIVLLVINGVSPSNKAAGYRIRLFSKKIISDYGIDVLNSKLEKYIDDCINYWINWQKITNYDSDYIKDIIKKELDRNGNRYILDALELGGFSNVKGVNINVSREEFLKRLKGSEVDEIVLRKVLRREDLNE